MDAKGDGIWQDGRNFLVTLYFTLFSTLVCTVWQVLHHDDHLSGVDASVIWTEISRMERWMIIIHMSKQL